MVAQYRLLPAQNKRVATIYAKEVEAHEVEIRTVAFKAANLDLWAFIKSKEIPSQHDEYIARLEQQGDPLPVLGFVHRLRLQNRIAAVRRSRSVGDFEV